MRDLKKMRSRIDATDKKLIDVLSQRFLITREVGEYKKEHGLKTKDAKREKEMLAQRKKWARESNIDPDLADRIFKSIVRKVCQENQTTKNAKE
ncbi:MAG: chorismate mutase [Candidatus Pacebacteria bacterium]|nr:chorismate mutase [Candidatus Paceibacterota bacterium]